MEQIIHSWLTSIAGPQAAQTWTPWLATVAIALAAWLSYWICVRLLIPLVEFVTKRTSNEWDDDLLNPQVLKAFSQLAPAILIAVLLPDTFHLGKRVHLWTVKLTDLYILWASINFIIVFLRGLQTAVDRRNLLRQQNLEILRQTIVLFVIIVGCIIGLGILIDRDPLAILAGLGASAAVLMLVFRDTILGFVAGVQLTVNKMLVVGDWIVMPKANANGMVTEVRLTTVKVRNWDNSIVTIPPYTLFSEAFQNYSAMQQSGARRVARSVFIDQSSIRQLDGGEFASLAEKGYVSASDNPGDTNLTLMRRYLEKWLSGYPEIIHAGNGHPDLTLMVRELQPTPQGLPLELYFFTSRTEWKPFEHLQADILDRLYDILPAFCLKAYQAPASHLTISQQK